MLIQTNIVLAVASDPDNPITAAITSAIENLNPSPEPSSTPSPSATPTPQPTADPIATPSAMPSPTASASATPSAQPISSPITADPSNCLSFWIFEFCWPNSNPPISTPVVNPTPAPSTSPTPTATPEPVATPVINSIFPNPATQGTRVTLTGSNFSYSSKLYIGGNWPAPQSFYSVSEDGKSLTFVLTTELNYQAGEILPVFVQNDTQKSNTVNLVVAPSIVDPIPDLKENQKLIAASLTLDAEHPEAVIVSTNFNADINIPTSVAKPTLKFANRYINQNKAAAYFNNIININAETEAGVIKVQIPSLTTISGPLSWNGIINAPQVKDNSTAKPDADQGKIAVVAKVIEVGADEIPLTFNNAVRLLIPGQAGKLAGYQRGSTFSRITQSCAADSKEAGDNLSAEGDCTISAGGDLVIWTKHFTKFVTYSQTAIQSQGNSSGSSSNASNPSSPSNPPVCTDVKPASAPKLISAKATGKNEVTLSWTKAADPVTYYLVAYGTKSGQMEYGNPNIGGKDTSSYVVKRLNNNQTYYFKVRAGNNCMPGEFSNELAVKASGGYITAPAKGFKAGVLSAKNPEDLVSKNELKYKPITQVQPGRAVSQPVTIVTKIISLFAHLLNRQ